MAFLSRTFIVLILTALVISACQKEEEDIGESMPPTETPTQQQSGAAEHIDRPDAPPYAARGPFRVGYRALATAPDTGESLEIGSWYPALVPDRRK